MGVSLKTNDVFEGIILDSLQEKLKTVLNFDPVAIDSQFVTTIHFSEEDRDDVEASIVDFLAKDNELVYRIISWNDSDKKKMKYIYRTSTGSVFFANIGIDSNEASIAVLFNSSLELDKKLTTFFDEQEEEDEEPEEEDSLIINYIYNNDHSANLHKKKTKVDDLPEIKTNYSQQSFEALEQLRDRILNGVEACKVAYISGDSGSGKTYALQSLMQSLRHKYQIIVIYDAYKFLSDLSLYEEITSELIKEPSIYIFDDVKFSDLNSFKETITALVGGLFSPDRKDVFIFASDSDVKALDKAFTRNGRCIAQIELCDLSSGEVDAWLLANEIENKPKKLKGNLAELYALKSCMQIKQSKTFGLAAGV